jgi:tetratricopeptide (TPR) repeat protein
MATNNPALEAHIEELREKLAKNPKCGMTQYNLGVALLSIGDWIEAEVCFRDAVTHSPTLSEAYVQLGGIAMHRGDLEGCLNYNRLASQARPMFATPFGNIGFVYLQQGNVKEAAKALERAVKLDPNFVQALATLGSVYLTEGDAERCLDVCKRALAIAPQFGPAYNQMGIAYLELGDKAKAVECIDKAIETGLEIHPQLLAEIQQIKAELPA